jgi:enoyl-CoA hydratase/carnithine racemase
MTDKIRSQVEDGIGRIVFNQPEKRNAVSLEMWQACERVLEAFETDDAIRAVVFAGAGDKAFVAGADISKFEDERATEEAVRHYNATTARVYSRIQAFAKPTIAEITGACVGGGVALAVCCDLRIAGAGARFAIPAAKLGLGYGFVGIKRLVDIVGVAFAKEIFLTARMFDAEEARDMGLVNRVVPDDEVAPYVADYAGRIAANAPLTVMAIKAVANETVKDAADRDLEMCRAWVDRCFASRDYVEGRRAFMEKRKPVFIGS